MKWSLCLPILALLTTLASAQVDTGVVPAGTSSSNVPANPVPSSGASTTNSSTSDDSATGDLFGEGSGGGKSPVEITSDGETRYEGGLAVAEDNVVIYSGSSTIFSDYAQYNPTTHDVLLKGHVKIYQGKTIFTGESALYNLDTKNLRSSDFLGDSLPFRFRGDSLYSLEGGGYGAKNGYFTTHDSSNPDYQLRARTVRIYPNDRIIFTNATLFLGKTPVFWWPYLYQSLNETNSFLFTPGYSSKLGAYLLTDYTFPIRDGVTGEFHLDFLSERGIATGLDLHYRLGDDKKNAAVSTKVNSRNWENPQSWGNIRSYYLSDSSTDTNLTSLSRPTIDTERYRVSWQSKLYITDDWSATIDVNKLSDSKFLEDFYPSENRLDPQPDTVATITKRSENWTLTALARGQINDFQQTTERLPEIALDVKRTPLFNTGIFYEGETSVADIGEAYPNTSTTTSTLPNFRLWRADTFHQFTYPKTFFGWLSVVPRAGFRATYYERTGSIDFRLPDNVLALIDSNNALIAERQSEIEADQQAIADYEAQLVGATPEEAASIQSHITGLENQITAVQSTITAIDGRNTGLEAGKKTVPVLNEQEAQFRTVFNFGVEASFKISKVFDHVESRALGLDGLMHVIQPYANFSFVAEPSVKPSQILPVDAYIASTELAPIDFPQFVALDSIDEATVLRLGVRNRLLTKRDDRSFVWMSLDTFFNINYDNPYDAGDYSNLFNRFYFSPVPWASLTVDSQLPVFETGFTEVNTSLNFQATKDFNFSIGHRYLQDNPFFADSSLITFYAYYQLSENWAVSMREQYELQDSVLESQRYSIHRDLTSWVASVSAIITDNGTAKEDIGLYISFTLKDLPNLNLNLNLDPSSSGQQ